MPALLLTCAAFEPRTARVHLHAGGGVQQVSGCQEGTAITVIEQAVLILSHRDSRLRPGLLCQY